MSETKEILKMILSDKKLMNSSAFKDKVYVDEPIIKPASQLPRPVVPQKIKEMKGLAFTPEAYWKTSAWLFYTQGKFMEDYEDNYEYQTDFVKYYPTYRDLTAEQARGYFSWRTNVRNGQIKKAPLPFVYIYIYELINCIGSNDPQECFDRLKKFAGEYCSIDESIKKYTDLWLKDFIVYYGLPSSLADDLSDLQYDKSLLTLINYEGQSENDIFEAINTLSLYQITKSLYYLSSPDEFRTVLINSFIKLSDFFRNNRKNSLCSKLFGNIVECTYNIFASAVFYDRQPLRSCDYSLNEIHSFSCRNGKWSCRKYYGNRSRNGHLGDFVKAVDSLLRDNADFKYKISYTGVSKTAVSIIKAEIEELEKNRRKKASKKVVFDLSRLDDIRKSSDIIRDKLLVDEDMEQEYFSINEAAPDQQNNISNGCMLEKEEKNFLCGLLYSKSLSEISKQFSLLADSVNEKLFEHFSDTVIGFSSDVPYIIEDYTDELKKMFPKE